MLPVNVRLKPTTRRPVSGTCHPNSPSRAQHRVAALSTTLLPKWAPPVTCRLGAVAGLSSRCGSATTRDAGQSMTAAAGSTVFDPSISRHLLGAAPMPPPSGLTLINTCQTVISAIVSPVQHCNTAVAFRTNDCGSGGSSRPPTATSLPYGLHAASSGRITAARPRQAQVVNSTVVGLDPTPTDGGTEHPASVCTGTSGRPDGRGLRHSHPLRRADPQGSITTGLAQLPLGVSRQTMPNRLFR